jgi:hypothetical protein
MSRYGGLWGETDTQVFAAAGRAMLRDVRLVTSGSLYSNGYGYSVLLTFLVHLTGLSVARVQLFGSAVLAVWIILPAWLAYRELTGSTRGATMATVLILVQPEFLFPILRGTHEKFTRGLMFLCIYLLMRSIRWRGEWRRYAAALLAFYLTVYALISFNNLFATSFILALILSLALSLFPHLLNRRLVDEGAPTRLRLIYAAGIGLTLAFLFTFYVYAPARHSLYLLDSIVGRISLLFLEVGQTAFNPYQTISSGWTNRFAYLVVSVANWLLLTVSFALWSVRTVTWLRRRDRPMGSRAMLLWSLYGAFGFLGAVSILVDLSGAIAANLQHRMFPSFAMVAAALVADRVASMRLRVLSPSARRLTYGVLKIIVAFLGMVAVIKATNEPAVSNKWTYYAPAELVATAWSRGASPGSVTWVSIDERLRAAIGICCGWEDDGKLYDIWRPDIGTRTYMVSDVVRARARRLEFALPIESDSLRVYDNGAAEIYRLRPRTPFQR